MHITLMIYKIKLLDLKYGFVVYSQLQQAPDDISPLSVHMLRYCPDYKDNHHNNNLSHPWLLYSLLQWQHSQ